MDSTSSFSESLQMFPHAEQLQVGGTTCECFRVKMYGKLHFLKRLKPELRTNPHYVAALQKEFETGYRLDHPHLVHYAAKTDDGVLMDYVDGETLSQFVKHHPDYFRNRKNADRFLRQLLSVVGYLHEHQVVHLDLKPDNILITRIDHDVVLVDLGYCYTDSYIDTKGRTDKYAAPEQIGGSSLVDARTDIYAIGRILQTLPCANYYNRIIRRCIAQEPAKRFQSVDEIRRSMRLPASLVRNLLPVFLLLVAILLVFMFWHRPQDTPVPSDATKEVSPPDTVILSQKPSIEKGDASLPDIFPAASESKPDVRSAVPLPQPNGSAIAKSDGSTLTIPSFDQSTSHSPSASSLLPPLSESEMEKQIRTAISPVFQRVMGSLRDSTWNRNTQEIYNNRSLSLLEQCGSQVRTLQFSLSKHYYIDERTFYQQYAHVLTSLSNNLYDQMLKNGK